MHVCLGFHRYGIGAATDMDGQPQTDQLLAVLDAASAAGMYVLIEVGDSIDSLARARAGIPSKTTGKVHPHF